MRNEDIMNAALHYCDIDNNAEPVDFVEGAMWADAHPAWISVEDALPPLNGYFLFYGRIGEARIMDCHTVHHRKSDEQYLSDCIEDGSITHWMPLPAPPSKLSNVERIGKEGL